MYFSLIIEINLKFKKNKFAMTRGTPTAALSLASSLTF